MTTLSPPPWYDLLPELLNQILILLAPVDVARFRAVCRAWHSAVRRHHQPPPPPPWVVLPNGSFCTIGDNGTFFNRIAGLPDNVTCLGASGFWLALDRTDDVVRRTNLSKTSLDANGVVVNRWQPLKPRSDIKHNHSYLLYNLFSGKTVPLPELDRIVGHVPETFEIRKVIMRSDSPEDLVAITTSNQRYPTIVCRPGKGWCVVLPYLDIFDVAFFGRDRPMLYGITLNEDLIAFNLVDSEGDDGSGDRHVICKLKRAIKHPLADGAEDRWAWMDDIDDYEVLYNDEDYMREDGEAPDGVDYDVDEDVSYHAKDETMTTRLLVESCNGQELLMVRHRLQSPPFADRYIRKLEIFKADLHAGHWVPVTGGGSALAEGEALFLCRSSSKATNAYGDIINGGSICFVEVDQVFDTSSWSCKPFRIPWQTTRTDHRWLTWFFPPKLVV